MTMMVGSWVLAVPHIAAVPNPAVVAAFRVAGPSLVAAEAGHPPVPILTAGLVHRPA
jgi:hypothetical protein